MARIIVNADTETREVEVTVDGEVQPNVSNATFYVHDSYERPGKKDLHISISMEEYADNGIRKMTHLIAKESKEGSDALKAGAVLSSKYRDFVILGDSNKLQKDISDFFSN